MTKKAGSISVLLKHFKKNKTAQNSLGCQQAENRQNILIP